MKSLALHRRRIRSRRGSLMVELAVCMPVIFVIVFASIEACDMIAMKQIISESAYDGALVALKPDAKESDVVARVNATLTARGVTPSGVSVTGAGGVAFSSLVRGDTVTVRIDAATDDNVVSPQLFGFSKTLSSSLSAIKQ